MLVLVLVLVLLVLVSWEPWELPPNEVDELNSGVACAVNGVPEAVGQLAAIGVDNKWLAASADAGVDAAELEIEGVRGGLGGVSSTVRTVVKA